MSIVFNDNILVRANKHSDDKLGIYENGVGRPYNSVAEALASNKLQQAYRVKGLTIQILKNGKTTEYWWRDGIGDNDLIEKVVIAGDLRTSLIYNSIDDITNDNTILAVELKDCDLTYFIAHRGVGTSLKGTSSTSTDNTVQVNVITGEVIFKYPFTSFKEEIWFEYKIKSTGNPPIINTYFPYNLPITFN